MFTAESMRTPRLVAIHKDIDAARRTATIYRLMVEAGADSDGLTQAVQEVRIPGALTRCWRRWIERVNFPNPPVKRTGKYRPITTGSDLRTVALRHRNCMRRYVCDVMEGSDAFAMFEHPEQELVLHLRLREGAWFLEGCHSKGNGPIVSAAKAAATEFLADYGIELFKRRRSPAGKWEPLRNLLARWNWTRRSLMIGDKHSCRPNVQKQSSRAQARRSSTNSEAGSTPLTYSLSRARVPAT